MSESTFLNFSTAIYLVTSSWDPPNAELYGPAIKGRESAPIFVIGTVGLLGNGLVLVVLCSHKVSRTRIVNLLIINQSAVDALTSFMFIVTYISKSFTKNYAGRGIWFCWLLDADLFIWILLSSSTTSLIIITIERYSMIVHPIFYLNKVTRKSMILALVLGSYGTSVIFIGGSTYSYSGVLDGACVLLAFWPSKALLARSFSVFLFIAYFVSPVVLFLICYGHMLFVIMKRQKVFPAVPTRSASNDSESASNLPKMSKTQLNVTKVMAIVSVGFVVCWGPAYFHYMLMALDLVPGLRLDTTIYRFTSYMSFVSCCINPFLYAWKYEDFKKNLARMISRVKNWRPILTALTEIVRDSLPLLAIDIDLFNIVIEIGI